MKHEFCSIVAATIYAEGNTFSSFSQSPIHGYLADNNGLPLPDNKEFDAFPICTLMPESGKTIGGVFHQYASGRSILLVPKGHYSMVFRNIPVYYVVEEDEGEQEDVEGIREINELEELPEEYYKDLITDTGYPQPNTI